ncbi:GspH/FimT family pseudopilin [Pseudocolwellia sp. HL-MZ19]|uniref:GspH/FimT family pseudopilin n=1 Tax=unclassified Pseudocolwellia TaxID=2848178 RepID=UPI003CF9417A
MNKHNGFTLIELLTSVSILMFLITIGMPALADFTVKLRVDREISALHKMIVFTKNTAVNSNTNITICPLNKTNVCTADWHLAISVFSDHNKNKKYEPLQDETILKVKEAIDVNDKLQYGLNRTALVFGPTGHLVIWGGNATFKYCPKDHEDKNRGIIVSRAGRAYQTTNLKNDGLDRNRSGVLIICK